MMRIAAVSTSQTQWIQRVLSRQTYLFALFLLLVAIVVNYSVEPNFFRPAVLSGNLQTYLPLILLSAGQTIIILGGGVDLSIGAIISLVNVVMVQLMGAQANTGHVSFAIAVCLLVGALAGAINGFCVAYLRFQPIVTTFATSFSFSGLALWILPSTGGHVPQGLLDAYQQDPFGIPLTLWAIVIILMLWSALSSTRYGRYIYAVGGDSMSAYVTGVPVSLVRFSTYVIAGLLAACSAFTLVLSSSGTGDPLIGGPMTLTSIVAVVIGGTRLRGGQGGVAGSIIGVIILGLILNIIAFTNIASWWQTLVNGLIVMLALAVPGFIALFRRRIV
jgi:ribose transport system permease protein